MRTYTLLGLSMVMVMVASSTGWVEASKLSFGGGSGGGSDDKLPQSSSNKEGKKEEKSPRIREKKEKKEPQRSLQLSRGSSDDFFGERKYQPPRQNRGFDSSSGDLIRGGGGGPLTRSEETLIHHMGPQTAETAGEFADVLGVSFREAFLMYLDQNFGGKQAALDHFFEAPRGVRFDRRKYKPKTQSEEELIQMQEACQSFVDKYRLKGKRFDAEKELGKCTTMTDEEATQWLRPNGEREEYRRAQGPPKNERAHRELIEQARTNCNNFWIGLQFNMHTGFSQDSLMNQGLVGQPLKSGSSSDTLTISTTNYKSGPSSSSSNWNNVNNDPSSWPTTFGSPSFGRHERKKESSDEFYSGRGVDIKKVKEEKKEKKSSSSDVLNESSGSGNVGPFGRPGQVGNTQVDSSLPSLSGMGNPKSLPPKRGDKKKDSGDKSPKEDKKF